MGGRSIMSFSGGARWTGGGVGRLHSTSPGSVSARRHADTAVWASKLGVSVAVAAIWEVVRGRGEK